MSEMTSHSIATEDAEIVYDVRTPDVPGEHPLLVMIGQPMDASGFTALAEQFADRTVVTYDPRGLGRSTRTDGTIEQRPEQQAADVHAVIEAVRPDGGGSVDLFASSGGAVTALALVTAHPDDVRTLVAHEPPLVSVLSDAGAAERAIAGYEKAYADSGSGTGMAAFIAMTGWQGEFTDEYFTRPPADPAQFGMPSEDDGRRDDPLLSGCANAILEYPPDVDALRAGSTRIVLGVGEETGDTFTGRTSRATAALLGQEAVVFPSHHGGFVGGDNQWAGKPVEFGEKLHELLD